MGVSLQLGRFRLDLERRILSLDGSPVAIQPKAVDLLCELAAARGEVVSKVDLLQSVWQGAFVEEGNLSKLVYLLRRELGTRDDGAEWIQTVPKRGYRLAVEAARATPIAPAPTPGPPESPRSGEKPRHFYFGTFHLDAEERLLRRDGVVEPLAPKLVDTLLVLVAHAGRLVTRDELVDAVWKDVAVTDASLTQNVWLLRQAIERDGGRAIETVARRGYRFVAPLGTVDPVTPTASAGNPPPVRLGGGKLRPVHRLVGRERDVEAVIELLGSPNTALVTIHGAAGCGKTTLALEVLRRREGAGRSGDCVVDLSALRDPAAVPGEVARALGVEEDLYRPTPELVGEFLAGRDMVLVLDNFEQLLDAASHIARWIETAPRLRILVTSQRPLRLRAERIYRLRPLAAPRPGATLAEIADADAVKLYVERSRAQRPDFSLDASNAAAVAAICGRLEGLPLAIELAAARSRAIGPQALLEQLDAPLALLRGGPRDAPQRQQSLRQALDWSHDLLTEAERSLFRRLAVHAGTFTLAAIEAIAGGEVLDELEALVDANLVETVSVNGPPRFRLLAAVRDYSAERLAASGESLAMLGRHADHYLRVAVEGGAAIPTDRQVAALSELALDVDNFRAARRTLAGQDPVRRLALAAALGPFWHMRGYWLEARDELAAALAGAPGAPPAERATALLHLGRLNFFLGDEAAARDQFEAGLAAARAAANPQLVSRALTARAQGRLKVGEDAAASDDLEEALPQAIASGDAGALAEAATASGALAAGRGDYAAARGFLALGLDAAVRVRDGALVAQSLYYSCGVALLESDPDEARRQGESAIAAAPQAGDASWAHHLEEMYARSLLARGETGAAAPLIAASLVAIEAGGSRTCLPHGLEAVARLAMARGQHDDAARLLGAVEGLCETIGIAMLPLERSLYRQSVAALGETATALWLEGRGWPASEATRRALVLCAAGA